jgi:hypothetical protein
MLALSASGAPAHRVPHRDGASAHEARKGLLISHAGESKGIVVLTINDLIWYHEERQTYSMEFGGSNEPNKNLRFVPFLWSYISFPGFQL